MNKFTFAIEASNGALIAELTMESITEREARKQVWSALTDEQRDAAAAMECVDEVLA